MAERVRIMTHNVWNCDANCPKWQEKGEDCSAAARVGALLRVYRETLPDIIGGQEVSALMTVAAAVLSQAVVSFGIVSCSCVRRHINMQARDTFLMRYSWA